MKNAPTLRPASCAAATAERACSTVIRLFMRLSTSSFPDSMPKKTRLHPAVFIANASSGVIESTRPRHSHLKESPLRLISAHISNKRFLLNAVSYTHLRAHETRHDLVCRLLLE